MFTRSVSLAAVLLFIPMLVPAAEAQEFGNAARGRAFAAQICSDCHQTELGNAASPDRDAPPFTAVAKTKGMTAMALGVWLHLSEHHEHAHVHEELEHSHEHVHDAHHQHLHDSPWNGRKPHTHPHRHARLSHSHPHYPDLHHRHSH